MSLHELDRIRRVMGVAWDARREKQVLDGALRSSERREVRNRVAGWAIMVLIAALSARVASGPGRTSGEERAARSSAKSGREGPAAPAVYGDGAQKPRGLGGFAGMTGAGTRGRTTGSGGNAGTG